MGRPPPHDTESGVDLGRRLAPGTLLAGRYRIETTLGMGGMGVVYRARDEELGAEVAVKVLRPDLGQGPEWLVRFRREILLAREVTHRNVVRIHDIGEDQGLRFLTMSYVAGRSLQDVLGAESRLPVERALPIVRQVADALAAAHQAGVVHRDLKPANILLDVDDTAYISDFGVARSLQGGGPTRTGVVVGTPDYLAPEQVAGDPADHRSDIYALGLLLHEMLTGELPFAGDSQAERLAQRLSGRVRDVSESGVRVPAWVRGLIRRCLERDPARRYQTAQEVLADLDRQRAARAPFKAWRAAVALVAVLLLALGGWAAYQRMAGKAPGVGQATAPPPPAVAVLPLADETADPELAWTGEGVAEMLAARVAERPQLRVIDALRVSRTLRDLGLGSARPDEATLRRLAGLLEAERLVYGSVRRAGHSLRVDLRLVTVGSGGAMNTRALGAETADANGLFGLVGDLAGRLASELGAPVPTTPEPHTTSLSAARAYREGRGRLAVADLVGAAPAFERAVTGDPGFAAALERLAETYQGMGRHEQALSAAERAVAAASEGDSRTALRARARLALLRGEPAMAEKSFAALVQRYPNDVDALLDLASAQEAQGDLAGATETLEQVTSLDKGDPRGWFLLGKSTIRMGDARKAVDDYLLRALTLQTQLRNAQGRGDALNALGVGYHELGDYDQALEKYSAAAEIRKQLGDERGWATSLKNRARVAQALGRFDQAVPDLEEAARVSRKLGDRAGLADVINDQGALREGRADYAGALRAYQEALRLRRELGDEGALAQSYDNVGYIHFLQGEYDGALVYWRQGLDLRKKLGDKGGVVLSTQNLGFLATAQGRLDEAMKSFVAALEMSREIDFKNAMAVSHGNIGLLHQHEGRYAAALASYHSALELLRELGDKRGLAEYTLKEAGALSELGMTEAARAKLEQAEPWVREVGNREQAADLGVLRGEWLMRQGDREGARRTLAKAVADARASHGRAALLHARLAAETTSAAPAAVLAGLLREADSLGEASIRIRAGEALAAAQLARGRIADAEGAARRALDLARRAGFRAARLRLHSLLGAILERKPDAGAASREQAEAGRIAGEIRAGLSPEQRTAFDGLPAVRQLAAMESAK